LVIVVLGVATFVNAGNMMEDFENQEAEDPNVKYSDEKRYIGYIEQITWLIIFFPFILILIIGIFGGVPAAVIYVFCCFFGRGIERFIEFWQSKGDLPVQSNFKVYTLEFK
jgi:hypothetical protein